MAAELGGAGEDGLDDSFVTRVSVPLVAVLGASALAEGGEVVVAVPEACALRAPGGM